MLRIITGSAKNIRLKVPSSARPMMDRPKSAIFSILQPIMKDSVVLDLYSGSGAMGLECLSRGAKHCKFVEITNEGVECIKENIIKCKFDDSKTKIIRIDAVKYMLKLLHKSYRLQKSKIANFDPNSEQNNVLDSEETYDIIFLCPPHTQISEESVRLAGKLLGKDGVLVAESRFDIKLPDEIGSVKLADVRNYGKLDIYFYLTK